MYFLGQMSVGSGLANSAGGNLSASAASGFAIPNTIKSIWLVPDAAGVSFEVGIPTSPTGFFDAGGRLVLAGPLTPSALNGPFRLINAETKCQVVVSNPSGGIVKVRVFGSPTS